MGSVLTDIRSAGSGTAEFLPTGRADMTARGWQEVDIVLVSGDAYIDHPSFGISLIGRLLEAHGYRVAILSQPRHDSSEAFREFGRPRLFFGITSGNLDSIVANYSGNGKVRDQDSFSPDGNPYFGEEKTKQQRRRPDRAVIRYASLAREAWPEVPIILGGLEASLRRFIHFDFQQGVLRGSVLTDAKADLLVYGMGERAILEAARRLSENISLTGIAGTCERLSKKESDETPGTDEAVRLPSWEEIKKRPELFMEAELVLDRHARALSSAPIYQEQQGMVIRQNGPAEPLTGEELDTIYALPFRREPHPSAKNVPAWQMIKDSLTIVRGCSGNCSFCAITRHQGPVVISRSVDSIVAEVRMVAGSKGFRGTISDLGGPTANLFGTSCKISSCKKHDCFYPELCRNLQINEKLFLDLLDQCEKVAGVNNLHISSGLRMELLLKTPRLLERLIEKHLPGSMKIAPEHTGENILRLMHKPGGNALEKFLSLCRDRAKKSGREARFNPYFISAHPGCTLADMKEMASTLKKLNLEVRQFQDFTPTPGTLSTAMFVTELDRETGRRIFVAKNSGDKKEQRRVLEATNPPRFRKKNVKCRMQNAK
ncbi:MAG: YgiQ family radical SAM protein [Proteobacteria bacterium]|nr:YgiQ family radical SAM protein [Pseudomonadota bacterium]MBU1738063.1 YgiQ family radical SAM protein [Pseudomonadota bacterium]